MKNREPIGVFDSGVGGISVLRELVRLMPQENYLYLGDSLHAPYGTKPLEQVRALTVKNVQSLLDRGAKAIVVACNTATSAAVALLRKQYPELPLVGIEPAIKPAALAFPGRAVVVMATPMTLQQEKFQRLMQRYADTAEIIPLPCPGLMEFIERGDLDGADLKRYLTELFWSVQGQDVAAIVLGCTHYPFVRDIIAQLVGEKIAIFDGGSGTAREMKRRLTAAGLLSDADEKGEVLFLNSRDTKEEQKLCRYLLEWK